MIPSEVDVSICILGLNAGSYLQDCLASIYASGITSTFEIIYADNHSSDDSVALTRANHPDVKIFEHEQNLGYARGYNPAIRQARGRYVLLLNPDTLVPQGSIQTLADYLDQHPQTGIVGPKVLNADGTFQAQCKRGEARPWEVICYFSGLSRLYPHDPRFSGYLQGHLSEDETNDVPAISGSCMMIRREVIEKTGLLDEAFFAYQEDTDYCVRARKAGWKVTYLPAAQITHYGGKGGAKEQPYKAIYEWHHSYMIYYRKHLAHDYFFLLNWFFYFLMGLKLAYSLLLNTFRIEKHPGPKRA